MIPFEKKLFDLSALKHQVESWKSHGETVVFTNGCFDILHLGHVTYLQGAAAMGTKLVVAVNTDLSVKALGKGDERPINPERARALVIASLQMVDAVVLFEGNTPIDVIETVLPSVLVKGADYDPKEEDPNKKTYIVGREAVLKAGGEVKVVELVPGYSTTSIVQKAKS